MNRGMKHLTPALSPLASLYPKANAEREKRAWRPARARTNRSAEHRLGAFQNENPTSRDGARRSNRTVHGFNARNFRGILSPLAPREETVYGQAVAASGAQKQPAGWGRFWGIRRKPLILPIIFPIFPNF